MNIDNKNLELSEEIDKTKTKREKLIKKWSLLDDV